MLVVKQAKQDRTEEISKRKAKGLQDIRDVVSVRDKQGEGSKTKREHEYCSSVGLSRAWPEELKLCLPASLRNMIEPHEDQIIELNSARAADLPGDIAILFHWTVLVLL